METAYTAAFAALLGRIDRARHAIWRARHAYVAPTPAAARMAVSAMLDQVESSASVNRCNDLAGAQILAARGGGHAMAAAWAVDAARLTHHQAHLAIEALWAEATKDTKGLHVVEIVPPKPLWQGGYVGPSTCTWDHSQEAALRFETAEAAASYARATQPGWPFVVHALSQ